MSTSWNHFVDLFAQVSGYKNPKHLNFYENGAWVSLSTHEVVDSIKRLALGLKAMGVQKGTKIGLMALPSPQWTIINFAVVLSGATLVPLFPNLSHENLLFETDQTGLKILFVDSEGKKLLETHKERFDIIEIGSGKYEEIFHKGQTQAFEKLVQDIHEDDLAAIIYTSATTGIPKGVMLTHKNLTNHLSHIPFEIKEEKTRYLSILPLAHIFGHSLNLIMVGWGASIYYFNDIKNVGQACQEIHPNMTVVVPRLLEKIYAKMEMKVKESGGLQRQIGEWAFNLANQEEDSLIKYLVHPLVDKIVYNHLRDALGGSIEGIISGGAPLNPHLNHFFNEVGLPIFEGWGLTEGCPITVNSPQAFKIGTVGKPFKGIELKIGEGGEVLVRGSLVMQGYYQNEEATRKTLDQEGWLHTGDKGSIDEEGFLTLQGRIKELYKTSTGEWIAPVPIEQMICRAPLIEMAMVIAEGRKYVSCLLFLNKEILEGLKKAQNLEEMSDDQFVKMPEVVEEMEKLLKNVNQHLNHWEEIRAYALIPHSPSIEEGELTPSMKLRRDVIAKKYKHLIDEMYKEKVSI